MNIFPINTPNNFLREIIKNGIISAVALLCIYKFFSPALSAQTALTWAGGTSGTWDLSTLVWNDGTNNVAYTNGSTPTFDTASAQIVLGSQNISAENIYITENTKISSDASSGNLQTGNLYIDMYKLFDVSEIKTNFSVTDKIYLYGNYRVGNMDNMGVTTMDQIDFVADYEGVLILANNTEDANYTYNFNNSNYRLGTNTKIELEDGVSIVFKNIANGPISISIPGSYGIIALNGTSGNIEFNNNAASAITYKTYNDSIINLSTTSGDIKFNSNLGNDSKNNYSGGAIYSSSDEYDSTIALTTDSGNIEFTNNAANNNGGALYSNAPGGLATIKLESVSGNILFSGNSALSGNGGAIYSNNNSNLYLMKLSSTLGSITFDGNTAYSAGGAIYSKSLQPSVIQLQTTVGDITFNNNKVTVASNGLGGAIYSDGKWESSRVTLITTSGDIIFTDNKATGGYGGGIYSHSEYEHSIVTLSTSSGDMTFSGNTGGVIFSDAYLGGSVVNLTTDSGKITFSGNKGTAIYSASFSGNSNINLETTTGTMTFSDNIAIGGGAIYTYGDLSSVVTITAGGNIEFRNNKATGFGGAIHMATEVFEVNPTDAIHLNLKAVGGDIVFSGNKHKTSTEGEGGVANAIYFEDGYEFDAIACEINMNLDASEGRSIAFYDPIATRITARVIVNVNQDASSTGRVLFSGKNYTDYADKHSDIFAITTVHRGAFELEGGAIYGSNSPIRFDVKDTAKLMGTGTVLSKVTIEQGGRISAGNGTGKAGELQVASLILEGGSIIEFYNGSLLFTGDLDLSLASISDKICIELYDFITPIEDRLFISTTSISPLDGGDYNSLFKFSEGVIGSVAFKGDGLYMSVTQVPEPSTYAAIVGLLVLGFVVYKRRAKRD